MISEIVFCCLAGVVLLSALGVVLMRNVLHCALALGLCLAGVAGIFAMLSADFLFAAQILIYVGGIAVLILFVVLLAGRASELKVRQVNTLWMAAILVCGVIFWGLMRHIHLVGGVTTTLEGKPSTFEIGKMLLGDQAIPFELVSLILLAALAGAIIFSKPEQAE